MSFLNSLGRALSQVLRREAERVLKQPASRGTGRRATRQAPRPTATPSRRADPEPTASYPGDFTGTPVLNYEADADREADPGEVVWTWVPYEEDHTRGKDRPVLIIGRADGWLLGLPLTSQDHDRDARQEAEQGRFWMDIGRGAWDSSGRASEVRVNRILRIDPNGIRRLAGRLDREYFNRVATEVMRYYGGRREGS